VADRGSKRLESKMVNTYYHSMYVYMYVIISRSLILPPHAGEP
jgi:hypothetical protein